MLMDHIMSDQIHWWY